MSTRQVSSFTIVLIRGAVYQQTFELKDDAGVAIALDSSQIDVFPNGDTVADFSWTQANGKFTVNGTGIYDLALTAADTASYTFDSGTWRWSIVQSGDANPCLTEGLIFVRDC